MTTTQQRTVRDVEQQPAAGEQPGDAHIHHDHIGHGSTPAAWALSLTLIVGSIVAGIGFVIEVWVLAYIGAACVPLALILGWGLKKAGYGVEMDSWSVLERGEDPRDHQGPAMPDNTSGTSQRVPDASTS
ncbi:MULTISPECIES: HGxxPAAW family protein [Nesterenkonia]|uniref:Uncharacterized protein n=1 Tax=Nesterenkonia xinjiangensis TaxID=225327 RepID=A0A7Z0GP29_9MICC|nr:MULTISPECIES: HGxxPAAW family protein [Nesterenkonia]MDZ5075947.1 hypothetical protein [Nesterenkonia sp. HG001]NYJ79283.1 hypothetical protein [Nesterenkonia xinjiangensis]